MAVKRRVYGEVFPIDEDFLAALAIMPAASGAALGFDRLVMLACGAERIDDVQWTPVFDPRARRMNDATRPHRESAIALTELRLRRLPSRPGGNPRRRASPARTCWR